MAWVKTFEPSGWASYLSHLNPYDNTLSSGESAADGSFIAPGVLFVLGAACAIIVVARLCCCEPTRRENRGKSMIPSLTFAGLAFLFTGIGIFFFLGTANSGYNTAMSTIEDAYEDTSNAKNLSFDANHTGTQLLSDLDALLTECPNAASLLEPQIAPVRQQVQEYMDLLKTFYDIIEPIPPQLKQLENGGAQDVRTVLLVILGLPIIFVTGVCLTMVFAVVGTACCVKAGSCCAKCEDFFLFRLGSLGVAGTILLVSAVSAVELGVGIGLSEFCGDADNNVLTLVNTTLGPGSDWYAENGNYLADSAVYYINGTGSNPLLDQLATANTSLSEVATQMEALEAFARNPLVGVVCPDSNLLPTLQDINTTTAQAKQQLAECNELLQPKVVYPYYQEVVHHEFCGVVIDGVAWLALFQFLTGMICLPCLACRAASFVHQRTFERQRTLQDSALLTAESGQQLPVVLV